MREIFFKKELGGKYNLNHEVFRISTNRLQKDKKLLKE